MNHNQSRNVKPHLNKHFLFEAFAMINTNDHPLLSKCKFENEERTKKNSQDFSICK